MLEASRGTARAGREHDDRRTGQVGGADPRSTEGPAVRARRECEHRRIEMGEPGSMTVDLDECRIRDRNEHALGRRRRTRDQFVRSRGRCRPRPRHQRCKPCARWRSWIGDHDTTESARDRWPRWTEDIAPRGLRVEHGSDAEPWWQCKHADLIAAREPPSHRIRSYPFGGLRQVGLVTSSHRTVRTDRDYNEAEVVGAERQRASRRGRYSERPRHDGERVGPLLAATGISEQRLADPDARLV